MKFRTKAIFLAVAPLLFGLMTSQTLGAGLAQQVQAQNMQSRQILGVVTLGQTTLPEFVRAIRAKGCVLNYRTETEAEVAPGCFKLPGDPEIGVGGLYQASGQQKINIVVVQYKKSQGRDSFVSYYDALRKAYGKPTKEIVDPLGEVRTAFWQQKQMVIILNDNKLSPEGTLVYSSPDLMAYLVREENQRAADLDKL